ncbi:MAG: MMPL family transporter [Candidatus Thalassarchaeaceae archaeon]|jgi:predicted RND superfamily exporter protein|nr:MMPL family transporter [Candidatus Thalassarchaeaceae archaeon]
MSDSDSAGHEPAQPILPVAEGESIITRLRTLWSGLSDRMDSAGEIAHDAIEKPVRGLYGALHKSPGAVIVILLLVTGFIGQYSVDFQHQINGDVEVYLPDGAESKDLLLEVREGWSTDIVMLYIHTDNAIEGETRGTCEEIDDCEHNVTSVTVLNQLSYLEGDDDSSQGNYARGLDWDKEDRGRNDGVVWVLSPAQIIKEENSAQNRFRCAMEEHGVAGFNLEDCPITTASPNDGYVIPQDQNTVNEMVENAGSLMDSFVRDTNGDGIWDTAVIVMGIRFEMDGTQIDARPDPKGEVGETIKDHKAFLQYTKKLVYDASDKEICPLCARNYEVKLSPMWYENDDTGEQEWRTPDNGVRRAITVTGLTPVLHDVSDAVYEQLEYMLPWSLAFVAVTMLILHRNPKVLIICGTPIVMSLAVTFGITVMADIELTPMIIAAGPILIGLGVDYALHLINRIEEGRNERLEEAAEEAWRKQREGLRTEEIDAWDADVYLGATVDAVMTTGNAILLSALTTIVGFSVLAWPFLVPIKPMRTVGLTLVLGIACTFFFSMIMVPVLGWVLRYRKKGLESADKAWKKIGQVPVVGWWAVILVAFLVSAGGLYMMADTMGDDITGSSDEVPPGLESYQTLAEYSRVFEGGQTNMFIVDATEHTGENDAPIRDLDVLDSIAAMEERIDDVPETTTVSLVTILKAVHVDLGIPGVESQSLWEILHDECWNITRNPDFSDVLHPECLPYLGSSQPQMVNVAFDTLSVEIRSMLMNEVSDLAGGETQTLVYVNQPYINLRDAGALRNEIDGMLSAGFPTLPMVEVSELTGGLPLSLDINKGVHDAQTDATFMTMFVLLFVMAILFRSFRLAFFTMTAVGVVVLWQPLLMYSGDVNVNVFTAMVSTIVFGIGVDDSIHIIDRIREEKETPAGIVKTVSRTGQTIFETTATTCAGLGAGLLVDIPGLRNFFFLMMMLITFALLTSSILLPAMLVGWHTLMFRMRGKGEYQDLDIDVVVANSTTMDAILD